MPVQPLRFQLNGDHVQIMTVILNQLSVSEENASLQVPRHIAAV
jgi:hypothetical protein